MSSEQPKKKKKLLGFPSIIWNQVKILNDSQEFKDTFGNEHFDLLIIATDDRRAAIVHVKEGTIAVDQIKTKADEFGALKKAIKPRIITDTTTFLGLAMGKVDPVKALVKGKLKIRRVRTVLKFTKVFSIIKREMRKGKAAAAASSEET